MTTSDVSLQNRHFYLGRHEAVWRVVEVRSDNLIVCQMTCTHDYIYLSVDIVQQLVDEYEEYWASFYVEEYAM